MTERDYQYDIFDNIINTRQITDTDVDSGNITWDQAQWVSTSRGFAGGGYFTVSTPTGDMYSWTTANDDGGENIQTQIYSDAGPKVSSETVTDINAFGYTIDSTATDWTSVGAPKTYLDTTTDAFGRVQTSTVTESVNGTYSAVTSSSYLDSSGHITWNGPLTVTSPSGSVTQYAYNSAGQVKSVTVNGVSTYDTFDAAGDLIQTIQDPDSATLNSADEADYRVMQYLYNWQGDVIATKAGVWLDDGTPDPSSEDTTTNRPLTFTQYDDGGQVIANYTYNGTGIGLSDFAGSDGLGLDGVSQIIDDSTQQASIDSDALRAYSSATYDNWGNTHTNTQYSVDPGDGIIDSNGATTTNIYNDQGQLIYNQGPTGLVTRTTYFGNGNVKAVYTTDG